jgi:hypothetical protein
MIKNIIDLLTLDDFYGISENIDFAKGINKKPYTWKDVKQLIKRNWKRKK